MKRVLLTFLITFVLAPLAYGQKDEMKAKVDSLRSTMGATVGEEQHTVRGGRVQEFEKGAIFWSPKTGARVVKSDVLAKYKSLGAEKGKLGFPVSDERSVKKGMSQTFEHGFLRTTTGGDMEEEIIPGATLTQNSLTIADTSRIRLNLDGGVITFQNLELEAPVSGITCSCELPPSPGPQRLGFCTAVISKNRRTATCKVQSCNGTCAFEKSDN